MSGLIWTVSIVIGTLFIVGSCNDADPSEDPVPAPTVTATATNTATPTPIVRTQRTVPAPCRLAVADARTVEEALFAYEKAIGNLSEIHDLTATGIASRDISRINKARELFSIEQSDSTGALQILLTELQDLRNHNKVCREELSQ